MKTKILLMVSVFLLIIACKKEPKATIEEAETVEKVVSTSEFNVLADQSFIVWDAKKIVGGHDGTFHALEGNLQFTEGQLAGGKVTFDIATLKVTNMPEDDENYAKLTGHLLSPDFFDAEQFPNATFEITNVSEDEIKGNLTIKGISKNIAFKANVNDEGDHVSITSDPFTIDRTEWDIKYNSGKFADPAKLGDFLIKDDVEIKVNVKAKKK